MSSPSSPDRDRLWGQLMELAEFCERDQPGFTRRVFSEPYRRSREWVRARMEAAGLAVRVDAVGNLLGELPGTEPGLPPIALGSHTDTVAGGGRFDGMVGVLGAIEVARLGEGWRHPILVADFLGEEPNAFGLSCLGSQAVAGQLTPAHLELSDGSGNTLAGALATWGRPPERLAEALWSNRAPLAYLELHIEQGRRLEHAGLPLGVVTGIAGIHRAVAKLSGRADHAGTAAMGGRRDALAGAAELVLLVERLAQAGGAGVGTVGRLEIDPGATNVVPGAATAGLEFRSADAGWLQERHRQLEVGLRELSQRRGLALELEWVSAGAPVLCSEPLRRLIREALEELGEAPLELESGASHDAAHLAAICPVGMIFIPSRDGRSHCPEEWSEPGQVALGVAALLAVVQRLDRTGLG
ncbi:MAG: Zn-dependent hydrolase [Candidatus Dormibacteria bacterium]